MSQKTSIESSIRDDVGEDVDVHDTKDPQAVFITTRSKMKISLMEYKRGIQAISTWYNPALLGITVLSVILVADFEQTFGLSGEIWSAIFMILLIISAFWLLYSVYKVYRHKDKASVEYVINDLQSDN